MISLLSKGAAGSFSMEKLGPRMLKRDFGPGFYVEHFVKDLGIVLDECRRMKLSVPGVALAYQMYELMMAQDKGRNGTQGLLETLEEVNRTVVRTYQ